MTAWADVPPPVLADEHVELRPVREEDREGLRAIALDPEIWRYFVTRVDDEADFDAFFDAMLADQRAGRRVCLHIEERATGRSAGSMSFGSFSEPDLRLEIGWSWLGSAFRGRGVNRRAKRLMLGHAFETLGAERVEFKTDERNLRARQGLLGIGAQEEGVLRSFNPMPDGTRRNAAYYSVLRAEWPAVQELLAPREEAAR